MNAESVKKAFDAISQIISRNKEYLIWLDSQNGDGDLGISMENGFCSAKEYVNKSDLTDVGKLLSKTADCFNESAPSSLGTIISFGIKGMARKLKGKEEFSVIDLGEAFESGISNIMEKAKSKPGEKTIIDSIYPAVQALVDNRENGLSAALKEAAEKAAEGSEKTKEMEAVWGRAAYYGQKSLGILDGGAVVGKLIFEGLLLSADGGKVSE